MMLSSWHYENYIALVLVWRFRVPARDDWTIIDYRRGDFLASSLLDSKSSSVAVLL